MGCAANRFKAATIRERTNTTVRSLTLAALCVPLPFAPERA
jgi:hypothetical protein